ncbi:hypothetical protein E4T50_02230 [Aureobasidium sp. EXF-12298]|nr:hypothetical protein E4T50_02230 [Aureobasidium sp. EXF-12298]
MPPKKSKRTGDKVPPKRVTRAAAKKVSDDESDGTDGAVKDGGKKPAKKPATPTKPAAGGKRKRTDDEDEEDSSPAGTKKLKKPKLSPKSARKVRLEEYLKNRIGDLGFKVEAVKGHDPDDEDEDEPDEDWASMRRLRQRCDDRLDEIGEAIRTIGREKYPDFVIPDHKSDETRYEKRLKNDEIEYDEEIEPIVEKKKISKKFPDGKNYPSAKELGKLVKELEQRFGDELAKRRVQHPHDYPPEGVKKAKEAAEAKGDSPKLTRSLDKQWNKHGLTLRELLDLYNRYGSQTPAPAHDDLVKKCKQYGLSTVGNLWDLQKAVLMYELASNQRMHGLLQEAINNVISALGDIEAPGSEHDDGGDDSADAAGSKGKDKSKDGKGTSASPSGKKGSKSPKGDKTGGTGKASKDGKEDGKEDGKKGGKKDDKDAGAAKKGGKRSTRSSKKKDLVAEDSKLISQKEVTVTEGGQSQRFAQTNVSGVGNRCMWHAVQLLWLGKQKAKGKVAVAYPVNDRVRDLWNAVMHPTAGTTNPAREARRRLYTAMQDASDLEPLETRIYNRQMGDTDMLQLVADALDIEIFAYSPQHNDDGTLTWHRYVRGEPQSDPARQIHLANYMNAVHWTALVPIGDGSINLPALGPMHRDPAPGEDITVSPLTRLQPGDEDNTDLRPEDEHDSIEDGHVADTTEEEKDDSEDEELEDEDEDGDEDGDDKDKDGADGGDGGPPPPPPPAGGAAVAITTTAAKRLSSTSRSRPSSRNTIYISSDHGSQSPPGSQKRARRRARARSKSQSRSTSRPQGVQKNAQPTQPLSKKARKNKTKALRKIFESFHIGMPSPQNVTGAVRSPYPDSAVFSA